MHGQSNFKFTFYGNLTFLATKLLATCEYYGAFYSRLRIWQFPNVYKYKEEANESYPYIKDPNLLERLITPDELSWLFIRAID
ncbi:MAG: hypothetical protein AAE988_07250 [Acidiplasma aeolicum]|jgi:hypothetical protein